MTNKNTNDLVNEALACWASVMGISEDADTIRDWDTRKHLNDLNESRKLDPTGLTTFMMLRGLADELFKETPFTALQLMVEPDRIASALQPLRDLRTLVEDPQVTETIAEFTNHLQQAASDYGMTESKHKKALTELLESKYALGFIRRDAIVSMETLEHHQFSQGPAADGELKKNKKIYEFLNANSAIEAALFQRVPGISMVLIRDPEVELASYFAFLVHNGGTVTMLTDHDEGPHPAYNRMSRRPDRNLERRAARNWFPYQLMDLEPTADGKSLHIHRTSMVRYNTTIVPLKQISELEPEQFVWAALMFDLIRERYGRKATLLPELSYTGEMVATPHVLIGPGSDLVTSGHYKPLDLLPLTREQVLTARSDDQWEYRSTGFFAWMEDRYGSQVPTEYLSVVGSESKLLLQEKSKELLPLRETNDTRENHDATDLTRETRLESLSPVTFGTRTKLQRDRLWVGRVNMMSFIQELADIEFEKTHKQIYEWWRNSCLKNASLFLNGLARGELLAPNYSTRDSKEHFHLGFSTMSTKNSLHRCFSFKEWRKTCVWCDEESGDVLITHLAGNQANLCFDNGTTPSVYGVAYPTCPAALALFSGVSLAELPWPLQHWYSEAPYTGNSILDRVEPSDWALQNPWMSSRGQPHRMAIIMALSKRAFHERRRKLGLPRFDIPKIEPDDESH